MSGRHQVRVIGGSALAPAHGAKIVVRGARDLYANSRNEIRYQPTDTHKGDVFTKSTPLSLRPRLTCSGCELTGLHQFNELDFDYVVLDGHDPVHA